MGRGGAYIKCTCTLTTSGASSLSSSSSSSSSSSTPPPPYIGYSNHTMRASITAPKTVITSLDVIGSRYWNRCQRLIKIPESMAQNIEKLNQRSKFMYVRKIHARLDGLKSLKCLVYFTTCSDCTCALTLYYQPSLHFNEKNCWPTHATIDQGSNLNSWAHDSTSATSRPCSVSIIRCCTTSARESNMKRTCCWCDAPPMGGPPVSNSSSDWSDIRESACGGVLPRLRSAVSAQKF